MSFLTIEHNLNALCWELDVWHVINNSFFLNNRWPPSIVSKLLILIEHNALNRSIVKTLEDVSVNFVFVHLIIELISSLKVSGTGASICWFGCPFLWKEEQDLDDLVGLVWQKRIIEERKVFARLFLIEHWIQLADSHSWLQRLLSLQVSWVLCHKPNENLIFSKLEILIWQYDLLILINPSS